MSDGLEHGRVACLFMTRSSLPTGGKPYDIHERVFLFACDIVRAVEFLQTKGRIGVALSHQVLSAGTSVGANMEEGDGASSRGDFIAKNRVALKEAKEVRFRLRVCRRCGLLDVRFDPLIQESDELVRIIATIVHNAIRRKKHEEGR